MQTSETKPSPVDSFIPGNLFLLVPDTDFHDFIEETHDLLRFAPQILTKIENDLNAYALEKKSVRAADRLFFENKTKPLKGSQNEEESLATKIVNLSTGRPRMSAELVFSFLMIRGFLGGSLISKTSKCFLRESMTLHAYLETRNVKFPGITTILENVNQVSEATLNFIFDQQIQSALCEQLDDFSKLTIDSTAVKANSCWPTDAKMITQLLMRTDRLSQTLHLFGLEDFKNGRESKWLTKMDNLVFAINLAAGKAKSKGKLKEKYRRLLKLGEKTRYALTLQLAIFEEMTDLQSFCPSKRTRLQWVIDQIKSDLSDAGLVITYAGERVFKEKNRPSKEKKLSLSDGSAAYIQKGGRTAVIGYKPQLVRSENGFITSLIVPEGNAADSTQLVPAVIESMERTCVIAALVSTDDGYSSKAGRDDLLDLGVKNVSISGAKGKRLTDEEDWESETYKTARNDRSAVESLMFTIKDGFGFGELGRRGIKAVRAEMMEKVLAYNTCRSILLKKRRRDALQKVA